MQNLLLLINNLLDSIFTSDDEKKRQLTKKIWEEYFHNNLTKTDPHKTLLLAFTYFQMEDKTKGRAADLGTGTGRDALFLLKEGWNVLAIDSEQLAIDILLKRSDPSYQERLKAEVTSFSNMNLPDDLDLINAGYSLPFCCPQDFPACWNTIVNHLAIGGRFAGHFFGKEDEWANSPSLTILSQDAIKKLFIENFVIEYLQIEDGLIPSADGKIKHWHVYHIVAKKVK